MKQSVNTKSSSLVNNMYKLILIFVVIGIVVVGLVHTAHENEPKIGDVYACYNSGGSNDPTEKSTPFVGVIVVTGTDETTVKYDQYYILDGPPWQAPTHHMFKSELDCSYYKKLN